MPSALIIGVSGQDGTLLASQLLEKGYAVTGTSREPDGARLGSLGKMGLSDRINIVTMAPNDFRSVFKVLKDTKPDEIYNLSGQSSVARSFEQPVEAHESISITVLNLLECLRLTGSSAKLYNAGSSECFGNTREGPACEGTPFHPLSPYATAKASAFWTVCNYRNAYGMQVCSGILFNHESPLRRQSFVTRKIVDTAVRIASGSKERLQLGNLNIFRDWGWAEDYTDAMWRMLQQDELEDFVICTGESHTLDEFLSITFKELGLNWRDHTDHNPHHLRPLDIEYSVGNPEKAQRVLGWKASVKFDEMICRLVAAGNDRLKD